MVEIWDSRSRVSELSHVLWMSFNRDSAAGNRPETGGLQSFSPLSPEEAKIQAVPSPPMK
jgi:hypothetical protein